MTLFFWLILDLHSRRAAGRAVHYKKGNYYKVPWFSFNEYLRESFVSFESFVFIYFLNNNLFHVTVFREYLWKQYTWGCSCEITPAFSKPV